MQIFLCLVSKHLKSKDTEDQSTLDVLMHSVGQLYIEDNQYKDKSQCGLELAMDFCILSGEILKTVESMDHMEVHSYREKFDKYSLSIFEILSGCVSNMIFKILRRKLKKDCLLLNKEILISLV
jgi:hypothetical protein